MSATENAAGSPVRDGCPICSGTERRVAGGLTFWHDQGHPPRDAPSKLAVDAAGYVWRVFEGSGLDGDDLWSMASSNPDNAPIPGPVTFFAPATAVGIVHVTHADPEEYARIFNIGYETAMAHSRGELEDDDDADPVPVPVWTEGQPAWVVFDQTDDAKPQIAMRHKDAWFVAWPGTSGGAGGGLYADSDFASITPLAPVPSGHVVIDPAAGVIDGLLQHYLDTRGVPMPTEVYGHKTVEEANELREAIASGDLDAIYDEIADVAGSAAVAARHYGQTVEALMVRKAERDRGRGPKVSPLARIEVLHYADVSEETGESFCGLCDDTQGWPCETLRLVRGLATEAGEER